jgi:hypothetical protein
MTNYNNGKIYKIESDLGDKIYIGSTTKELLSQRIASHNYQYKAWRKGQVKNRSMSFQLFDEYGFENCKIILLEKCPCTSKDELIAREAYYISTIPCVNKRIEGRTSKQYCADNSEKRKQHSKEYRDNHKDELRTKRCMKRVNMECFECACGVKLKIYCKLGHEQTIKHKKYLESLN